MIERAELAPKNIKIIIMLSMGFQEQIEEIFNKIPEQRSKVQFCLFSAIIEKWVKEVANNIKRGTCGFGKKIRRKKPKTVHHFLLNH
jgi:superfamily II DNA/RNA helicase